MADSAGFSVQPDAEIRSSRNQNVRMARKLVMKKHRRRQSLVLVEGVRAIGAAAKASIEFATLFCTSEFASRAENNHLLGSARRLGAKILLTPRSIISSISTLPNPQEAIAVVARPEWSPDMLTDRALAGKRSVLVWFDGVSDPSNLGAIIRSAHCLGATGYLCAPGTVGAFNPRAVRASAGSVFTLPGVSEIAVSELQRTYRPAGFQLIAAAPRGGSLLPESPAPARAVVMVGEEAGGLSSGAEEVADLRFTVPMVQGAESLNVAAASTLILYHLSPLRSLD